MDIDLIQKIQFRDINDQFQSKMRKDLKTVRESDKLTVKADKTSNYYTLSATQYNGIVQSNVTGTYKKAATKVADH